MFLWLMFAICGAERMRLHATACADQVCTPRFMCSSDVHNRSEDLLSVQPPSEAPPPAPKEPSSPSTGDPTPTDTVSKTSEPAPNVIAILDALEKAGNDIRDIRCRVVYDEDNQVNLTRSKREGQIFFLKADPNPMFLVTFDRVEIDGRAPKDQKKTWYLFNGQSLFEAREATKHVIEREIAAPGEKVDFFDLDKAPFPLPFGQKKDRILERFEVRLVNPAPGDPPNTDHLLCIPRPGTPMARKYKKLDFYIRVDLNLPVRIRAVFADGEKITVADFPDLSTRSINTGLRTDDFVEPASWKNYTRDMEKLEE